MSCFKISNIQLPALHITIMNSTLRISDETLHCVENVQQVVGKFLPSCRHARVAENFRLQTGIVTGRRRGPKQKLRADYRAPSQHPRPMCRHSYVCLLNIIHSNARHYFSSSSVVSRIFSALCDVFEVHASCVANFVSVADSIAELAREEKPRTHSINHPTYLMPGKRNFRFGKPHIIIARRATT